MSMQIPNLRPVRIEPVKTWVEISRRRLVANYKLLQQAAGAETALLAVVKANAYGHAVSLCAIRLARAGAPWLGVADAQEGATLREALTAADPGQQPRILVMSAPLPDETALMVEYKLTPVLWSQQHLDSLTVAATKSSTPLAIHVEIDTGMARQGIAPGPELDALLVSIANNPRVRLEGVMTHFASSEVVGSPQTQLQRTRFEQAIAAVRSAGLSPEWLHAGGSSTIDNQGEEQNLEWLARLATETGARPMVRTGIALYGYCLPIGQSETAQVAVKPAAQPGLQPVMTWKARILDLREIAPDDTVGYNAIFTADRPMRLALLPIGYADGLRRELSGSNMRPGGWVVIHGQRAPIVGRISMNLTTVDVTDIPSACVGDEVTVLGDGITADDHARLAGTISYEILCGVRAPAQLTDD